VSTEPGRGNAAVHILASRLVELREEHAKGAQKLTQVETYVTHKAEAIAEVEAALVMLGVNPAKVEAEVET